MPLDYEIIAFSDDWNGMPTSCRHLLGGLLPAVPLTWVETIGLRAPRFNLYDMRRAAAKARGWLRKDRPTNPSNLKIVDPCQIPYNHLGLVRRINARMLKKSVAADGDAARDRVMVTTWPFLGGLVGSLGEKLSIYYRVDDFAEFPGVRAEPMRRLEKELMGKVDLVVASSRDLARIDGGAREVRYLPHGVDYEHFAREDRSAGEDLPVARIRRPRIGFFGLLDSWIDFELMEELAAARPEWSFVFIGPTQVDLSRLARAPNVHFLGPVPYQELPRHGRHFDVGLIPFKLNPLTRAVNPLKLLEYFALGLPVVSSPLEEVLRFRETVALASGPEEFARAIARALEDRSPSARSRRREVARSQAWETKSRELRGWIEEALEEKRGPSR